jgi:hypothetical protein
LKEFNMHTITRRSAPGLIAALAGTFSTGLVAGPSIDPIHAAIAAAQDALKEHDRCFDLAAEAEEAFFQQRGKLPHATYAGITFHTQAEVDEHFDAPIKRRALVSRLRETMVAQGIPVAPSNPAEYDMPVEWETYRSRVHRDLTAYQRARDELEQTTGMTKANHDLEIASEAMCNAESAVFATIPTTLAGAAALGRFAAKFYKEETPGDVHEDKYYVAFQSLVAFLARSA